MSPSVRLRATFGAFMLLTAALATADCKLLIDAFEAGGKQQRAGYCFLDNSSKCAKVAGLEPERWIGGNPLSTLARDLRDGQSKGLVKCSGAGTAKWGTAQTNKITVTPLKGGNVSFKIPMVFWIDAAKGLVVAQSDGEDEPTMAYQYGADVK